MNTHASRLSTGGCSGRQTFTVRTAVGVAASRLTPWIFAFSLSTKRPSDHEATYISSSLVTVWQQALRERPACCEILRAHNDAQFEGIEATSLLPKVISPT
jgi:hypothetical protein